MDKQFLKGTLFGGFRRSDVVAYVEKLTREGRETALRLQEEVQSLRRENDALRADARPDGETEALRAENARLQTELNALREECETLTRKQNDIMTETETLRAEAEEYRRIREGLADLQVEALRRADEIETAARERAEKTETLAYTRLRAVSRECREKMEASATFVEELLGFTEQTEEEK